MRGVKLSDDVEMGMREHGLTRRELVRRGGIGALAVGGAGSLLAACGSSDDPAPAARTSTSAGKPRYGGTIRVGANGGPGASRIEVHSGGAYVATAMRATSLFDGLLEVGHDYRVQPALAEEVTSDSTGRVWTIRLREGVTWHDGSPVTADDVAFSLARMSNPEFGGTNVGQLRAVDPKAFKKRDKRTLEVPLKFPYVPFADVLADRRSQIVKDGFKIEDKHPIGTGPFMFKSWEIGQRSVFVKNPDHFREGMPYLDELEIIDFTDPDAQLNALISGQVDVSTALPINQTRRIESQGMAVLNAETGLFVPFVMNMSLKPWEDVRVRQAFRLMVDRPAMLEQVNQGYGRVGNDIFSIDDQAYNRELPQREQDLEQAKSLLRQAGYEGLEVELTTTADIGRADMVPAAQVFAEQAKAAGVNVKVNKVDAPTWSEGYPESWPFTQTYWAQRPYLLTAGLIITPDAKNNAQHFNDPKHAALVDEAYRTVDEAKRFELIREAQKIEYETGGNIIWGFSNTLDAYNPKFTGFVSDPVGDPVMQYRLREVSLA